MRCFLVDDNEDFLASARRLLAAQGFEVIGEASTGSSALDRAPRLGPDVVLIDVQLGNEDGLVIARRLHAILPNVPVILISTHAEDDVRDEIRECGAVGFLSKASLNASAIRKLLASATRGT
jgi:two-component system nitrate/nitrite response regulator NarL